MIDKPIGHYKIVGKIGAGGMGEVYRARDTRLNRDVAIKVLPAALAADPDRLSRFDREAEALAALNHPNIAIVHTVVDRAIIMEFVDGEDLSARIARGPIPWDEALPIAGQVADALAAAHEAGIIHRDLKPANIKVSAADVVKVLDFGLAKAVGPAGPDAALAGTVIEADNSPALTATSAGNRGAGGTQVGMILGTAAYMSPEQARGKAVDKRADIWAFGCVLFEMLTGRRAFSGDDVADTIAFVLTKEPAWNQLPAATPARVRELLRRCLIKNPHLRLRDIGDARLQINDAIVGVPMPVAEAPAPAAAQLLVQTPALTPPPTPALTPAPAPGTTLGLTLGTTPVPAVDPVELEPAQSRWRPVLPMAAALVAGVLIGGAAVRQWFAGPAAVESPSVVHAALALAPADELNAGRAYPGIGGARTALAWSPDGKTLAFIGREADGPSKVFVRELGAETARPLAGTDGAEGLTFSADGREIAFVVNTPSTGVIRRIPAAGGPVTRICDARFVSGMTWSASRFIFADEAGIKQVTLDGGTVDRLFEPVGLERYATPQLLPGDSAVMFTQHEKRWTSGDERVMVLRLPDGKPVLLQPDAADARLLPNGQLAFLRQGTLFVVDFDVVALATRGSPRAVAKDVAQVVMSGIAMDLTLAGQFAVSSTGTLAFVSSPIVPRPDAELVGIDRAGKVTLLGGQAGAYQTGGSLSSDGSRIAVSVTTQQERRPYAFDLSRGTLTPLVPAGKGEYVGRAWSTLNKVAFLVYEAGKTQLVIVNADDPSDVTRVPDSEDFWPSAWSPDGTRLIGVRARDIWVYSAAVNPPLQPLTTTPATETHPSWSPNGNWVAFASNTSNRPEVFVRRWPGPGPDIPISTGGGTAVSWSRDGKELFFAVPNVTPEVMMAVNMAIPDKPGKPTRLFAASDDNLRLTCNPVNCYAVGTGSRQFVTTRDLPQPPRPVRQINLVLNWLQTVSK